MLSVPLVFNLFKTIVMKYLILIATMVFWFGNVNAQKMPASEVPTVVKDALMKAYSNPMDVEWEKKGDNYKVEFDVGKLEHELWISPAGDIMRHKEDVASTDLPTAIMNKLMMEYSGFTIDEVEKLTVGTRVLYKVELGKEEANTEEETILIMDENAKTYERTEWEVSVGTD